MVQKQLTTLVVEVVEDHHLLVSSGGCGGQGGGGKGGSRKLGRFYIWIRGSGQGVCGTIKLKAVEAVVVTYQSTQCGAYGGVGSCQSKGGKGSINS